MGSAHALPRLHPGHRRCPGLHRCSAACACRTSMQPCSDSTAWEHLHGVDSMFTCLERCLVYLTSSQPRHRGCTGLGVLLALATLQAPSPNPPHPSPAPGAGTERVAVSMLDHERGWNRVRCAALSCHLGGWPNSAGCPIPSSPLRQQQLISSVHDPLAATKPLSSSSVTLLA